MRYLAAFGCVTLLAATLSAAESVATVSSNAPFTLRGAEVPVNGVPSWPVFAGDDMVAGKAATIVKFGCGSSVHLNPGAEAHVTSDGGKLTVHLTHGDLTYKLSKDCPLAFVGVSGTAVGAAEVAGTVTLAKTLLVVAPIAGGVGYWLSHLPPSDPPPVSGR